MLYCSLDMVRDICNIFLFGLFFVLSPPLPSPLTAQEIKISKKNRKIPRYYFTHVYQKLWLDDVWFLRYRAQLTDGRKKFEQGVTLFGMKKEKRIVNQILLFKLWYIGQTYAIPKFTKEKIEKTIAQLSIWKCGLGILDIDTQ